MIKLNLITNCVEHNTLKEYLEENVSSTLAEKINNGVIIEKDGKKLLNKKDLNGFMVYACNEARKLAAKGATSACVKSDVVFGWAIHYFEEDSIEGKLFNEDGTEYNPIIKETQRIPTPTVPTKSPIQTNKPSQFNLFDILDKKEEPEPENKEAIDEDNDNEQVEINEMNVDMETGEILPQKTAKQSTSPIYRRYLEVQSQYPDSAIAYRLGDFYEIFGDKAITISNELDLTLTGRDCGLDERIPMIGFPYHASEVYFKKVSKLCPLIIVEDNVITPFMGDIENQKDENEPTMYEDNNEIDDFEEERALKQFFDKDALCALYELFDYNLDMQ